MEHQRRLKVGAYVKHVAKPIEGRIIGETRIKSLFEKIDDAFEYRVQTGEGIKICSPSNLETQNSPSGISNSVIGSKNRTETGRRGVQLVCQELERRGYKAVPMPDNNPGFDIDCTCPQGSSFQVEVKCSTSTDTQVPLQVKSHLEAPLQHGRYYVFLRLSSDGASATEFVVMTHKEVKDAWGLMPKVKSSGEPYVIGSTGYIDWKHLNRHREKWDKLPPH